MSNPFEYGQIWVKDDQRVKVLFVGGDVVVISMWDRLKISGGTYHYEELKDIVYELEAPKQWESLTADNWKDRRDKGVWCRDALSGNEHKCKIIGYEPRSNFPVKAVTSTSGVTGAFVEASIFNSEGIEAKWEEE